MFGARRGVYAGLTLAAALLLAAGSARAVGEWLVDAETGCRIWDGHAEEGESAKWDGPCDDGYASGEGTLYWYLDGEPNGTYVGARKNGKADGYGVNTWASGDRYDGYWKADLIHGSGTYTFANGSGYQGEWFEGKMHGSATFVWASGDRFEGTYKNDRPFGGIYVKADGSRYIAEITGHRIGPGTRFFTPEERAAVRTVGAKICHPGAMLFDLIDTTITGFVEEVEGERVKIRVARTGVYFQTYEGISINQGTIIWDDAENWEVCRGTGF